MRYMEPATEPALALAADADAGGVLDVGGVAGVDGGVVVADDCPGGAG